MEISEAHSLLCMVLLATIFLSYRMKKRKDSIELSLSGLHIPDSEHDDVLYADHV